MVDPERLQTKRISIVLDQLVAVLDEQGVTRYCIPVREERGSTPPSSLGCLIIREDFCYNSVRFDRVVHGYPPHPNVHKGIVTGHHPVEVICKRLASTHGLKRHRGHTGYARFLELI